MSNARKLVATAKWAQGRTRLLLLTAASKIVVELREPRTDRAAFRRAEWRLEVAIGQLGSCAGCLATGASLADKQLFARVKRAVNAADPIRLLRAGAPDDEYHAEIEEIANRLSGQLFRTVAETHRIVHWVFARWFSPPVAGPRRAYLKLARALHALRPAKRGVARNRA